MDIENITNGSMNGEYVWICDYRYKDISEKPIRHIRPQKVLVRSNDETKKRIYYSESHFIGLNKKNEPVKSKVIPVFDATGYRSYTGVPVNVFDNEKDCNEKYVSQCAKAESQLDEWIKECNERYSSLSQKVTEEKFKYFKV